MSVAMIDNLAVTLPVMMGKISRKSNESDASLNYNVIQSQGTLASFSNQYQLGTSRL
jgi:hypothetical protein